MRKTFLIICPFNKYLKVYHYLLILLILICGVNSCKKSDKDILDGPAPYGISGNWKMIFSDEFNGTSLIYGDWTPNWVVTSSKDPTQIGISEPVYHGPTDLEWAVYDPENVTVSDGNLNLSLTYDPIKIYTGVSYNYRSGMIQTMNKFWFTYGVFEARIYLPAYRGDSIANWPAFWLAGDGTGGTWPLNGELDIVEGINGRAHYAFHSVDPEDWKDPAKGATVPGDFTGWHTYAANWQKGIVEYYYDGKLVGTVSKQITNSPMYMILNQAIGANSGKKSFKENTTMLVDYVRVWQ